MAEEISTPVEQNLIDRISAKLAPEAQQPEQQEPVPDAESQPEGEEEAPDAAQVEEEEAPQGDAPEVAEIPIDQLEAIVIEVKVKGDDGKDVVEKQSIKELREGYMRKKDYSRKTAEVARQREQVAEQTRQARETERATYQKEIQTLHSLVMETAAAELKDVDWNKLATNDPFEYVRLENRRKQFNDVLVSIKSKNEELTAKQKAEQDDNLKRIATTARAKLEQDIPGFDDTLYSSLIQGGTAYDYKPEEVAKWVDPRAIKLLHDALQFRELKVKKPRPEQRVVTPPRVVKPGAAQPTLGMQQYNAAKQRFQKSGSLEDAAAVIRAKLG